MQILLDTHIVLWWLADDSALPTAAAELIANPSNEIVVSAATAWDVSIKRDLGKLRFDGDLLLEVDRQGFRQLPITFEHAQELANLPDIHRDPFDRMLVSQARVEDLRLLTADRRILQYPVNLIAA